MNGRGALRFASLLAILVAVLGVALFPNPLTATSDYPKPLPPSDVPFSDVSPLAAVVFLEREVEPWKRELTMKMAHDAGIGWIKVQFAWEAIEPRRGQDWDDITRASTWEKYDQIVALAAKYGLRVIARLDRPPEWARPPGSVPTSPPERVEDFGNYVHQVVSRYKGKIRHFQIWNEPNLSAEWGQRPVDPAAYVELLKVAYEQAKSANPDAVILSAPLAQTLENGPNNLNELDYLEAMYRAGAQPYFDILSANGYGFDLPPEDPPNPQVLNFQRVVLLHDVMVRNGDSGKAVWLNEFGWNAAPSTFPAARLYWQRVSDRQQAEYTTRAIELAQNWDWLGVISLWYFRQVGDIPPSDAAYYFRVVDVDFVPRPVYHAVRRLGESLHLVPEGRYAATNQGSEFHGNWNIVGDPPGSPHEKASTSEIGATNIFRFVGTDLDLYVGVGNQAGTIEVLLDGRPINGLGREQDGKSYIDLHKPTDMQIERLPIVAGASLAEHTLEITLASNGTLIIDGFEVQAKPPSYTVFYGAAALFTIGLAGLVTSGFIQGRRR